MSSRLVLYVSSATAALAAWLGYCGGQAFRRDIESLSSHCAGADFAFPLVVFSLFTCPWLVVITAYREAYLPLLDRLCLVVCVWALMLIHIYGVLPAVQ